VAAKRQEPAIAIRDLRVIRGSRKVIRDISINISPGSLVGLLGPSGSGKTTLMRAIVGAQIIAGGSVTVLGKTAGSPELRSDVGYVTQSPSVYADLTAHENLQYFAQLAGVGNAEIKSVLKTVDLHDIADRPVMNLSGGQRSRVSLAAALLGTPEVLILDEPTVGLDPVLRKDLWDVFRSLVKGGATLLVSSHVMDEAQRCDRLIMMREGEILAHSTLPALLKKTKTKDVEGAFLALATTVDTSRSEEKR